MVIHDITYQYKSNHTIIALQFAHLIVFNICFTYFNVSDYNALWFKRSIINLMNDNKPIFVISKLFSKKFIIHWILTWWILLWLMLSTKIFFFNYTFIFTKIVQIFHLQFCYLHLAYLDTCLFWCKPYNTLSNLYMLCFLLFPFNSYLRLLEKHTFSDIFNFF